MDKKSNEQSGKLMIGAFVIFIIVLLFIFNKGV